MANVTVTQSEKADRFAALHAAPGCFVIPNPWDPGSARILENLGFKALATTSAGYAFSIGLLDGAVGLDMMIEHCRVLCAATNLPVSADLENGYSDDPKLAAQTLVRGAEAGLVGEAEAATLVLDTAEATLVSQSHNGRGRRGGGGE